MIVLFKLMMLCAPASFVLYLIEAINDRVTLRTQWSQLTRYQWCLVAGVVIGGLGFLGLLLSLHFSK